MPLSLPLFCLLKKPVEPAFPAGDDHRPQGHRLIRPRMGRAWGYPSEERKIYIKLYFENI